MENVLNQGGWKDGQSQIAGYDLRNQANEKMYWKKQIKVISVSDAFPNKRTKKYFRQYMDVVIDPNSEKKAVNQ